MSLSLYEITIPPFIRAFKNLGRNLEKGKAFADENGFQHEELLQARLYPDMLPLIGQVQRASDTARFVAVRVGNIAPRPMEDNETTFAELQSCLQSTIRYLKEVPQDAFDGREQAEVKFKAGSHLLEFRATDYVLGFAIPNFYFHAATAYDILRHKGVPIGKADFLGG